MNREKDKLYVCAMKRNSILQAIEKESKLPPVPQTVIRLRRLIDDPEAGIAEVEQVIKSDPVLSGRLVQLANSVFASGSGFMVTSLTRAVARLGLKMAMDVAYSLEVPKMFEKNTSINQEIFWKHSLACAVAASRICKRNGGNRDEQANAYLGGLMRNIGILIFCHLMPKDYSMFLKKVQQLIDTDRKKFKNGQNLRFDMIEKKIFGIDHLELGARYVEKWWPVDPKVIDYIQSRAKPMSHNVIEMAERLMITEKIPNGVYDIDMAAPPLFFIQKYQFGEEEYRELSDVVSASLNALG